MPATDKRAGEADTVTVVAVHGNGGGASRYARVLAHVPPGVRVRPVTLPGFDGRPADPALQSVRDYADRLAEFVRHQPAPVVLLGHGIGGTFALELLQRPEAGAVEGLILHAPVGTRLDTRLLPRVFALPGLPWLAQRVLASEVTRPALRRLAFRGEVPPSAADRFFDGYRRCAVFGQMFRIITSHWFDGLRPVDLPAVLLWGERERVLAVDQLDDYRRLLPRATVRRVPDWDHFPMVDHPREYAAEIATLARRLVGRG